MPIISRRKLKTNNAALYVGGSAPPAYTGPGDYATARAFWGLRGYSAAYSTGSNPAIDVIKSDGTGGTTTINILADGSLDVATISGLGYAVVVSKVYDQTGNGHHMVQTTNANRPALSLAVFGALPAMAGLVASDTHFTSIGGGSLPSAAQPYFVSFVAKRTGNTSALNTVLSTQSGNSLSGFNSASGSTYMYSGAVVGTSATENALHSIHDLFNGASSEFVVDGGAASTVNPGADAGGLIAHLMSDPSLRSLQGYLCEASFYTTPPSSGARTSLATNEKTYWGIS
jgi:hypothetical protein